jgi:hypothetical protein
MIRTVQSANPTETINLRGMSQQDITDITTNTNIMFGPYAPKTDPNNPDPACTDPVTAIFQRSKKNTTEGTLIISPYLDNKAQLWVWDWDDTLIDTQAYRRHSMEPEIIRKVLTDAEIIQDVPNANYFRRLVQYLVTTGRRVGIASFGTYSIIRAYMDRIFGPGQQYFGAVNILATCPEIGCRRDCLNQPLNKNAYILRIMKHYRIQSYSAVVLFDDLASNIADAMRIGCMTFQIDESTGYFGPQVMLMIEARMTDNCAREMTASVFGSLGDRKRWKYDDQAYSDIFTRTMQPDSPRAGLLAGSKPTTTLPVTSNTSIIEPTYIAGKPGSIPSSTEGFASQLPAKDTCVTCRAGTELWVIAGIMILILGLFIWFIAQPSYGSTFR